MSKHVPIVMGKYDNKHKIAKMFHRTVTNSSRLMEDILSIWMSNGESKISKQLHKKAHIFPITSAVYEDKIN